MTEQKPELPAIAVDIAEWRFAQQKESLERKGPAAVLRSKNRINSRALFFATFFCADKRKWKLAMRHAMSQSKIFIDEKMTS